ncbi:hypothetical protein Cgig2_024245 [Carnegiea gigantea]|uniref:Phosphoglycerate mutase n=1 Tax=Carnegiea gigantea TaxID=171969 RepID=A0A9Q1Q9N8_9CARY|nr:hypothetical protein Cgig2_024245 [Carnegiea gigantea]
MKLYPTGRRYFCTGVRVRERGAPGNTNPSATTSKTGFVEVRPLFLSTDLPGASGAARVEELVNASFEEELEDDSSEEESANAPSEEELVDVPVEEELELVDKPQPSAFESLKLSEDYLQGSSSGLLTRGVDFVLAIRRAWKSFIKSAIVISHGYKASSLILRILGVEEYSQLDHGDYRAQKSASHRKSFWIPQTDFLRERVPPPNHQ